MFSSLDNYTNYVNTMRGSWVYSLQRIKAFNVKGKTIKLLEDNIEAAWPLS